MFRRVDSKGWLGRLGIMLLILGLGRVPLPIPVPHGKAEAGESGPVCLNQEHLESDCPTSDCTDDASGIDKSVRWHWVVLNTSALCGMPSAIGSEEAECHPDWSSCEHDPSPHFLINGQSRRFANPSSVPHADDLPALTVERPRALARPVPALLARNFVATYPPRTSLASLFQRWTC